MLIALEVRFRLRNSEEFMLSVKCFSRNCSKVFANKRVFHPAYNKIWENEKPRNKFSLFYRTGVFYFKRETLPRMVIKHEFVYAQNRAYSRIRLINKRAFLDICKT